jgi:hypothetical protein
MAENYGISGPVAKGRYVGFLNDFWVYFDVVGNLTIMKA